MHFEQAWVAVHIAYCADYLALMERDDVQLVYMFLRTVPLLTAFMLSLHIYFWFLNSKESSKLTI